MENDFYVQVFKKLGVPIEPLPSNYSPEEFGHRLLSLSQTEYGVTYAASTDYVNSPKPLSDSIKNIDRS